jgi:hypothetical protein
VGSSQKPLEEKIRIQMKAILKFQVALICCKVLVGLRATQDDPIISYTVHALLHRGDPHLHKHNELKEAQNEAKRTQK